MWHELVTLEEAAARSSLMQGLPGGLVQQRCAVGPGTRLQLFRNRRNLSTGAGQMCPRPSRRLAHSRGAQLPNRC